LGEGEEQSKSREKQQHPQLLCVFGWPINSLSSDIEQRMIQGIDWTPGVRFAASSLGVFGLSERDSRDRLNRKVRESFEIRSGPA
jgi:hypothetical protein